MRGETIDGDGGQAIFSEAGLCPRHALDADHGEIPPDRVWFALLVHKLWSVKAPAALHHLVGANERTCRNWTAGDHEPPASVLRDLLRSAEGFRALKIIMDDKPPGWWVNAERHRILGADVERRVREGQ